MYQSNQKSTMDTKRVLLLLIIYFVIFLKFVPEIGKKITLMINPHAYMMNIPVLVILYILVSATCVYIARPVWKPSVENFKAEPMKYFKMIIYAIVCILLVNFGLSIIISLVTNTETSNNQQIIENNSLISPFYTFFYTCIIAPVLEETIFRGGIYTFVKDKLGKNAALVISSLFFGFIHVSSSLFGGNFNDLVYLILYAGIGAILGYAYERSQTIVVSVGIHAGNNLFSFILMML